MCLEEMKKKSEKEKMEEMHQHKVAQMMKIAEESAGLFHTISEPPAWRGGAGSLQSDRVENGSTQ